MMYLGVCAIIKDEGRHIGEWLAYYAALGAEAFYLYDNGSETPLAESLADIVANSPELLFRLHTIPGEKRQMQAYNHCLATYKNECRWVAFIDLDEFIVPLEKNSIPEMLMAYEKYAGLALSWKTFGTNGHKRPPPGLQTTNYTRALPFEAGMNTHVKNIVDPARFKKFLNPHRGETVGPDDIVVDVLERPAPAAFLDPPVWQVGHINHYYYRSREEFVKKLQVPRADSNTLRMDAVRGLKVPEGEVEDSSILRFVPAIKRNMRRMRGVL